MYLGLLFPKPQVVLDLGFDFVILKTKSILKRKLKVKKGRIIVDIDVYIKYILTLNYFKKSVGQI